jgi:O-antigen/teichoic acid export membrane protein
LAQSRILADVKSLAGKSAVYGLGSVTLKAIGFFLLPLYTRYLTPVDYGIIAVTGTLTSILTILYPLGLHGAATRFYFLAQSEDERRRNNGTIWVVMTLVALIATVLLDRFGGLLFPLLFRDVPFSPYIRLAVWISFFSVLGLLPLAFFQVQERPVSYVLTTVSSTLLTIGLVINFVVFQRQGVYGYLRGTLLALVLFAVPYTIFTLRNAQITLRLNVLKACLAFSLPLVPHGLAGWVLALSDRVILQRFVPLEELGLYSLGYQFGIIMKLLATAVNFAWVPFLYKTDSEAGEGAIPGLVRLVTYYTMGLVVAALGVALFAKDLVILMTTPAFYSADRVAPWIIGGSLLNGLYFIPINFLFLRNRTGLIPLITVSSGLFNIGLNLWLAPRYGIMAAAWATFLSYGLMLILAWKLALRVYPIQYEYKRLGLIALTAISLYALGIQLQFDLIAVDLVMKGIIVLAYPFSLAILGFFTPTEKSAILAFARQAMTRLVSTVSRVQF